MIKSDTSNLHASTGPRVSCLLPVYNGERFLNEAIDSILNQTFTDFELIAVDDGSTDGTAQILSEYAENDVRVKVVSKENGGIVSALNAGLAVSWGDYIARMDSDDIAKPHRFAYQVDYLDRHHRCVLVGGISETIAADGTRAGGGLGRMHQVTDLSCFPPKVAVSLHPLIMMRRKTLVAIGGYRDGFPHAEDYDLFIRLGRHGTIENPREVVLTYRRHEGAVSLRHLELQERSAALSEIDARCEAGLKPIPDWLVESYIRFRIWRRYLATEPKRGRAMNLTQLADALSLSPRKILSRWHWRLRFLIGGNLVRSLRSGITKGSA